MNFILQDQVDDVSTRFTHQYPLSVVRVATPAISAVTTPYSSQCFLTTNSPRLSSRPTALETKMCGKVMVITSYFKDATLLITEIRG